MQKNQILPWYLSNPRQSYLRRWIDPMGPGCRRKPFVGRGIRLQGARDRFCRLLPGYSFKYFIEFLSISNSLQTRNDDNWSSFASLPCANNSKESNPMEDIYSQASNLHQEPCVTAPQIQKEPGSVFHSTEPLSEYTPCASIRKRNRNDSHCTPRIPIFRRPRSKNGDGTCQSLSV